MAKDEWQQPDIIGVHPQLAKLAEKTKKLIELECFELYMFVITVSF